MPEKRPLLSRVLCFLGLHRWAYRDGDHRSCVRCGYREVRAEEVSGFASGWRAE